MDLQKRRTLSAVFFILTSFVRLSSGSSYKSEAYRLMNTLTNPTFYQNNVIPIDDPDSNVSMTVQLQLLSILSVSEKEQQLVSNVRLSMTWGDDFLSWSPSEFLNISSILLNQAYVWLPDITVANTVEPTMQMGFPSMPCRVYASGRVEWKPGAIIYTSCAIDVTYFPMDSQICFIKFETLVSLNGEVNIKVDEDRPILLEDYKLNGQWDLVDTKGYNNEGKEELNKITFSFLLKRRRAYYILNILLPVSLLSLTGTLAFALPADAGEKMGMCLTVLLAYTVYLTIVSDELPNTSVQVSILSVYLALLIAITACTVILSVFILRLHHRDEAEEVGPMTEKMVNLLKKITCSREGQTQAKNAVTPLSMSTDTTGLQASDLEQTQSQKSSSTNLSSRQSTQNDPLNSPGFERAPPQKAGSANLCFAATKSTRDDPMTWQEVAKTLDRFFFLLMSGISLSSTVGTAFLLFVGSEMDKPSLDAIEFE